MSVIDHPQWEYKVLESQEEGDELDHSLRVPPASAFRAHVLTLINAVVLLASLVCLLVSFRLVSNRQRDVSHGFNILGLELPIASIQVEGDFGNDDNYKSSIYRKPPGPEVDAAWARIANSEMIAISTEDVIAIGKDPTTTVRAPEEWNLGPDAHLGVLDVFHQIHCLNALRRGIYYEHYFAPSMGDKKGDLFYNHMGHCMSILLQNIMCAASLDVITHNWVRGHRLPVPDFSIQHQCRDIEAVIDWQEKNSIDYKKWSRMRAPKGATVLEPSEALLEAFEAIAKHTHANGTVPF
ncbi:hypothetical protein ACCO45_008939 [Purpureocillium lilacinum]|uniref:Uncharacterized protein n=1 Tax=Purpureocillium lilacinum TaxID=33203 RepID=A0ACC4DLB9_PURLI